MVFRVWTTRVAASASLGDMLDMRVLKPEPESIESETLEVETQQSMLYPVF